MLLEGVKIPGGAAADEGHARTSTCVLQLSKSAGVVRGPVCVDGLYKLVGKAAFELAHVCMRGLGLGCHACAGDFLLVSCFRPVPGGNFSVCLGSCASKKGLWSQSTRFCCCDRESSAAEIRLRELLHSHTVFGAARRCHACALFMQAPLLSPYMSMRAARDAAHVTRAAPCMCLSLMLLDDAHACESRMSTVLLTFMSLTSLTMFLVRHACCCGSLGV